MKLIKNLAFVIVGIVSVLWLSGCSKDSPKPSSAVTGLVTNVTGKFVANASVSVYKTGGTTAVTTVTSNSTGTYSISVDNGTYDLKTTATGYLTTTQSITVNGAMTQNVTITGAANVSGVIIDSQTGQGLSQAKVSFFANVTTPPTSSANADLTVTTSTTGTFTITGAPTGSFSGLVESSAYYNRSINSITFTAGSVIVPQQTAVSKVPAGQLRIILTWGVSPSDLDTHLTGPTGVGSNRFHLYFITKTPSPPGTMSLDVDDTYSYGPETTTLKSFFVGTYRYSVHNYSDQTTNGSSGIASSPALVELYDANGLVRSFSPPSATSGNTWKVFELLFTSSGYTLNVLNFYSQASYSDGTAFRSTDKSSIKYNVEDF